MRGKKQDYEEWKVDGEALHGLGRLIEIVLLEQRLGCGSLFKREVFYLRNGTSVRDPPPPSNSNETTSFIFKKWGVECSSRGRVRA